MRNRGQSAVVGVILLVALTVVLATTAGAYSFGLVGNNSSSYSPIDSDLRQTGPASQGERSAEVVFEINRLGEEIPSSQVDIVIDGERVENLSGLNRTDNGGGDGLGAGDSIVVNQTDRTGLHGGMEVQVVRIQGETGTLLDEMTLEGRNVSIGSFDFSYYNVESPDTEYVCSYYSGSNIDSSRISIEVYNGVNWVSPQQYYNSKFNTNNLISTGKNRINSYYGDEALRVVYESVNGETVLYKEDNANYGSCG